MTGEISETLGSDQERNRSVFEKNREDQSACILIPHSDTNFARKNPGMMAGPEHTFR
jgi:hypothetical protein